MSLTTPILRRIHFGAAAAAVFLLGGCSDEPTSPEQATDLGRPSAFRACADCDGEFGGGGSGDGGGGTGGTDGAPLIFFETNPTAADGNNGWFKTDVTLSWVINPRGTFIGQPEGCDDRTINTDQETGFTCSATNGTGPNSVTATIKRDATAPVVSVTGVTSGATYLADAVPAALCNTADVPSGVKTPATLGTSVGPTGAITVTCSGAEDVAGNLQASPVSVTYTVSAPVVEAPIITATVNPSEAEGPSGWYTSDVALSWNIAFNAGEQTSMGCGARTISSDQGPTEYTCEASNSGVGTSKTVSIKRDATAPVISIFSTGCSLPGNAGWCRGAQAATFSAADDLSGLAAGVSSSFAKQSTIEGTGILIASGSVSDVAGNVAPSIDAGPFKIDRTAPVVEVDGSDCTVPGSDGWCRGTQQVTFSAQDATSGLPAGASPFTRESSVEGTAVLIASGPVSDVAGNEATGINSGPFKIDRTAPQVSVTGVTNGATYAFDAALSVGCSTTDALSGVQTQATATIAGGPIGQVTASCSGAMDKAGNAQAADVSVTYTVSPPPFVLEGFSAPVSSTSVNTAKAGQTIALKWRLLDGFGTPVTNLADVKLTVTNYACDAGVTSDLESEDAAGNSGLQNLGDGFYQYNWKTPKSYANSCKLMRLQLLDVVLAAPAQAQFFFKR